MTNQYILDCKFPVPGDVLRWSETVFGEYNGAGTPVIGHRTLEGKIVKASWSGKVYSFTVKLIGARGMIPASYTPGRKIVRKAHTIQSNKHHQTFRCIWQDESHRQRVHDKVVRLQLETTSARHQIIVDNSWPLPTEFG